jgi:hypothetical protein
MRFFVYLSAFFLMSFTFFQQKEREHTCIDEKGNKLFTFKAWYVYEFSEGLASFATVAVVNGKSEWRYGYMNDRGKIVLPPVYTYAYHFYSGVAWVKFPGETHYTLIDKTGKRLTTKPYSNVGSMIEGMGAVYEGDNMGYVDSTGKEVIPCKYFGAANFSDGLVCLCPVDTKTEMYGFLDKAGNVAIPFKFKQGGFTGFVDGECRVQVNGVTCLIDKTGKVIFTPKLVKNMDNFSYGLSLAYTKPDRSGFGFFNRNNEWVIKPVYTYASGFDHGYSIVEKSGKYGVIDTTGKEIIPIIYETVYSNVVTGGYWVAKLPGDPKLIYLNKEGKKFTTADVKYLYPSNGFSILPYTANDGLMGYLNTSDGTIFIKASYTKASTLKEGKAWVY